METKVEVKYLSDIEIKEIDKIINYSLTCAICHINKKLLSRIKNFIPDKKLTIEANLDKMLFEGNINKRYEYCMLKPDADYQYYGMTLNESCGIVEELARIVLLLKLGHIVYVKDAVVVEGLEYLYSGDISADSLYDIEEILLSEFHKNENMSYFNYPFVVISVCKDDIGILSIDFAIDKNIYRRMFIDRKSGLPELIIKWPRYNKYEMGFGHFEINTGDDKIIPAGTIHRYYLYNPIAIFDSFECLRPVYKFMYYKSDKDYLFIDDYLRADDEVKKLYDNAVLETIHTAMRIATFAHIAFNDYIDKNPKIKEAISHVDRMTNDSKNKLAKMHICVDKFDPSKFKYK